MLSEKVLEELVRNTPLRQHLVSAAWPSLNTESRMQVLQAVAEASSDSVPNWLAVLGIKDPSPIVRYWTARRTYFRHPREDEALPEGQEWRNLFRTPVTDEDREIYRCAISDECPLVKARVDMGDTLTYKTLTDSSHFERLVFIRNLTLPQLSTFVEWLDEAVDKALPDEELSECAQEFFAHIYVHKELKRGSWDYTDGMDAYDAGKGVEVGWRVIKKAGIRLQQQMMYVLPTSLGLHTVKVEDLCEMPQEVLRSFIYRTDGSKEITAVIKLMREQPERFPAEVIKSLKSSDEYGDRPSPEQVAEMQAKAAVDRSERILDTVLELQQALGRVQEQMNDLKEAASRKRGFFG